MNFSNSSKLRKILSLILVMTMMVTLFAGCKKDDASVDTKPSNDGPSLIDPQPTETAPAPTETEPVVINENTATILNQINIRSAPTTESVVIGTLLAGDKVEVNRREEIGGVVWGYIISPQTGWISMEYVKMDMEPETPAGSDTSTPAGQNPPEETKPTTGAQQTVKGVINANGLNIREDASKNSKIVGTYSKGDVITVVEVKNGWGKTDKGWILMDFVTTGNTGGTNTNTNTNTNTGASTNTGNGSTTVQFKGIVTASQLNIRSDASLNADRVGSLNKGARVEILEKSGNWGRISKGWISLDHVYQDGTTGKNTAKGIVTGSDLNVRSGPGTDYASVGSLNYGDRVVVLEQFTYNGTTWGCTKNGWISMKYVYVDGTRSDEELEGYVTADELNIRSGPGTKYDSVGSLEEDDEVTILFILKVGDTEWGNIKDGWICLDYVHVY